MEADAAVEDIITREDGIVEARVPDMHFLGVLLAVSFVGAPKHQL